MKKAEYYINVRNGKLDGKYPKVSGYVEEVVDSKGNVLTIGYDKRYDDRWTATELSTGICVSKITCTTKKECVENVHNNIDIIVEVYNKKCVVGDYVEKYIKPFRDYVNANGGF